MSEVARSRPQSVLAADLNTHVWPLLGHHGWVLNRECAKSQVLQESLGRLCFLLFSLDLKVKNLIHAHSKNLD